VKTIWFDQLEYVAIGATALYYKIKNELIGFKCIIPTRWRCDLECMKAAEREYANLVEVAKRTKMTPRPYELAKVFHPEFERWTYGVIMEHIDGSRVDNDRKHIYIVKRALKRFGIEHTDLHRGNILITRHNGKKRYRVIDFTSVDLDE